MRHLRPFGLIAVLSLTACGGGSSIVEPPPPPVVEPVPAVVQLRSPDLMIFTGRAIPLRALVARVATPAGATLTNYTLTATATGGCAVRGDSLVASGQEARCSLKVRATYRPAATAVLPLFTTAGLDSTATDTATVASVIDLKSHRWKAGFACSAAGHNAFMTATNIFIDSMRVMNAVVDSVRYAGDSGWVHNFGGVAQVWVRGPMIRWLRNGVTDTVTYANVHTIHSQAPDTLRVGFNNQDRAVPSLRSNAPGQLLRYSGGTWCDSEWRASRGPLALEEW